MAHEEQATLPWVFEPLGAIVAEQKLNWVIIFVVCIHKLETNAYSDATECAKEDVSQEEHLCLFLEQLGVIPEAVNVLLWHVFQIDEIVEPIEAQIKDLVHQDKGSKKAECKRVKMLIAATSTKYADKQY